MKNIKRKPPRYYDKDKYSTACLLEFIEGRRKTLNKKQSDLGAVLGMTQQAFGYRMNSQKGNGNFEFLHLVKLFKELEATDEEILRIMKQN